MNTTQPGADDRLLAYFAIVVVLVLVWIVGVGLASIYRRLKTGKPIFRPKFVEARFCETWRSGCSHRTRWSRYGGAQNCLWVVVTDDELIMGVHFPFDLFFLPDRWGLEHCIRGGDITAVERRAVRFGPPRVLVSFRKPEGGEESFEVAVSDLAGFERAIEGIRGQSKPGI